VREREVIPLFARTAIIFMWSTECACFMCIIFLSLCYINGDKPSDRKNDNFKTGDRPTFQRSRIDIVCIVRVYGVYILYICINYYKFIKYKLQPSTTSMCVYAHYGRQLRVKSGFFHQKNLQPVLRSR